MIVYYEFVHYEYFMEGSNNIILESCDIIKVQLYFHSGTCYIINGNFGLYPLEVEPYLPLWSHPRPHSKTQLGWPKRLTQLVN